MLCRRLTAPGSGPWFAATPAPNGCAGSLRLAGLSPAVPAGGGLSRLSGVLEIYDSVDAARIASLPWRTIRVWAGVAAFAGPWCWRACDGRGALRPRPRGRRRDHSASVSPRAAGNGVHRFQPFIELLKLVASTIIGLLVTAIHQPSPRERPMAKSMEQAQTLLCVSGAMIMIIIGNSIARAFGIAGAASIVRFRTPVDDPKDVTILFLLMALGMSAGLGAASRSPGSARHFSA